MPHDLHLDRAGLQRQDRARPLHRGRRARKRDQLRHAEGRGRLLDAAEHGRLPGPSLLLDVRHADAPRQALAGHHGQHHQSAAHRHAHALHGEREALHDLCAAPCRPVRRHRELPSGVYHFASQNELSTYDAAKLIGSKLIASAEQQEERPRAPLSCLVSFRLATGEKQALLANGTGTAAARKRLPTTADPTRPRTPDAGACTTRPSAGSCGRRSCPTRR